MFVDVPTDEFEQMQLPLVSGTPQVWRQKLAHRKAQHDTTWSSTEANLLCWEECPRHKTVEQYRHQADSLAGPYGPSLRCAPQMVVSRLFWSCSCQLWQRVCCYPTLKR